MKNPFESIDTRLTSIENVLIELKNNSQKEPQQEQNHPLSIKKVSSLTGLTVPTLYSYCQKNEIPYHKKGNRLYFFKPEIIDWIKTGKRKTNKEIEDEAASYLKNKK